MTDQTQPENDRDTEQRILAAARRVFVIRGTAGARVQEIAAEAGVNPALIHYYFRSKEGLAAAVFREAAGRLVPAVAELFVADVPLEEKIERFIHLYIDGVRESPFLPGYIVSELHHHAERQETLRAIAKLAPGGMAVRAHERLVADLEEGAAEGRIRRIAPEQFMVNLMALAAFPFLARPALGAALEMDAEGFDRFLDERRAQLPSIIIAGLRP